MATKTLINLSAKEIKNILFKYKEYKKASPSIYIINFFQTNDLTISIYKNNKVLLQGSDKAIDNFLNDKQEKQANHLKSKNMIGMDEVGTGDYFGPIVTCSCYLADENREKAKLIGVDDSKKIDDINISKIATKLKKIVQYKICICMPKTYNTIIKQFNNANIVKAICHNDALTKLIKSMQENEYTIILDQFATRENYESYLLKANVKPINIDIITPKAESKYLAVACASVLARDAFINCMNDLNKKIGFKLPLGATKTLEIVAAGKKINKKLNEFAKLNFKSITEAILNK